MDGDWSVAYPIAVDWKGTVSGLSPLHNSDIMDDTPEFNWEAVDGAVKYQIQIAKSEYELETSPTVDALVDASRFIPTTPLTLYKNYYWYWRVRALDTDNQTGVWSPVLQISVRCPEIGDTGPAGGIVFYDKASYSDGWRCLEAATSDLSTGIEWGGYNTTVVGTTSHDIGTGMANTEAIVMAIGDNNGNSYAARLCYDLEQGGYDDWFLPSSEELKKLYDQRNSVGGFSTTNSYWSSSEYMNDGAIQQFFGNDSGFNNYEMRKNDNAHVRAVRAF